MFKSLSWWRRLHEERAFCTFGRLSVSYGPAAGCGSSRFCGAAAMSKSGPADFRDRRRAAVSLLGRAAERSFDDRSSCGPSRFERATFWAVHALAAPLEPYRKPVFSDGASMSRPLLPCSRTMEFSISCFSPGLAGRLRPFAFRLFRPDGSGRARRFVRIRQVGGRVLGHAVRPVRFPTHVRSVAGRDRLCRSVLGAGRDLALGRPVCTGPVSACGGPQAIPALIGCRRFPRECAAASASGVCPHSSEPHRPIRSPDRARAWRSTTARRRSP